MGEVQIFILGCLIVTDFQETKFYKTCYIVQFYKKDE